MAQKQTRGTDWFIAWSTSLVQAAAVEPRDRCGVADTANEPAR